MINEKLLTMKLLTITETACELGLSEEAVEKLVEKGYLPAYKISENLFRFKKEDIEKYRKRRDFAVTEKSPYTFWERFADFFYYNDFYILSLIILILTAVFVFGF